jgi:sterol desaturase/sphingolipid hydroxylase (fatty acid hydroxylase superfamily)
MPNWMGVATYLSGFFCVITMAFQLHARGSLGPWFPAVAFFCAVFLSRFIAWGWPLPRLGEPAGETVRHVPFAVVCTGANHFLGRPLMFLIAWGLTELLPTAPASFLKELSPWILVPVVLIVYELMGYLQHLACHKFEYLWRVVHCAHHEPAHYGTFLALRIHYFEFFFSQLTRLLFLHAIGVDPGIILVVVSISTFSGVMIHTDTSLKFGRLNHFVFTPETHIWHHGSESPVNFGFGLLTLFDKIGGTFWYRAGKVPDHIGIPGWRARGLLDVVLCRFAPPSKEASGSARVH